MYTNISLFNIWNAFQTNSYALSFKFDLWNQLDHSDALSKKNNQNNRRKQKQAWMNEKEKKILENFLHAPYHRVNNHQYVVTCITVRTHTHSTHFVYIKTVTMTTKTNLSVKPQQQQRRRHIGLIAFMTGKQTINGSAHQIDVSRASTLSHSLLGFCLSLALLHSYFLFVRRVKINILIFASAVTV